MRVIVCLKQVVDPLTPADELALDRNRMRVLGPPRSAPVTNGYDEQALEAALRLRNSLGELEVVALSLGDRFQLDVMKRALAVGADELVLVQDPGLDTWNAFRLAEVLAAAIAHLGGADLILCGRQASDWDNALVPLVLAEYLGLPCLALARSVGIVGQQVQVERALEDGVQLMEADLPAVVTVTSELGELRYPTVKARLKAARQQPRLLSLAEIGAPPARPPLLEVVDLDLPLSSRECQFVTGADGAEAGRSLAGILVGASVAAPADNGRG